MDTHCSLFSKARIFGLAAVLMFAASACDSDDDNDDDGRNETPFAFYDANDDGGVSRSEFGRLISNNFGSFASYDANRNGSFSEDEFSGIALAIFDPDDDDIDEDEFGTGVRLFFGDEDEQSFGDYDTDGNGTIGSAEFRTAFEAAGFFDTFDANDNDRIGSVEIADGFFDLIDTDGDTALDEDEFNLGVGTLFDEDLSM